MINETGLLIAAAGSVNCALFRQTS